VSLIWAALAGTIVYLDTTAIAQFMICQPLIACPLWGMIVGRPEVGLFFGVVFQLIWLGNLQIGAAKFAEGNIGAFVATVLACRVPAQDSGNPAWITLLLALLVGLFIAQLGSELAPLVRKLMARVVPNYVLAAESGNNTKVRGWFLAAFGLHVAIGLGFLLLALLAGNFAFRLLLGNFYELGINESLTGATDVLLSGVWPTMLGAGAAIVLLMLVRRKTLPLFVLSAVVIGALSLL
jgi:mannose/fructose/N-acetylgalactosamine-specific phosphotransferase system component IIC